MVANPSWMTMHFLKPTHTTYRPKANVKLDTYSVALYVHSTSPNSESDSLVFISAKQSSDIAESILSLFAQPFLKFNTEITGRKAKSHKGVSTWLEHWVGCESSTNKILTSLGCDCSVGVGVVGGGSSGSKLFGQDQTYVETRWSASSTVLWLLSVHLSPSSSLCL